MEALISGGRSRRLAALSKGSLGPILLKETSSHMSAEMGIQERGVALPGK